MCGIFGVVSRPNRFSKGELVDAISTINHRGPDSHGLEKFVISENWDLWLGHSRLAVIDLSPAANQPMTRMDPMNQSLASIVFNGELYNYSSLRDSLKSCWDFRSRSDTEVLLAGMLRLGPGFFAQLNSMMAMAFFDHKSNILLLARDRLGKKPLYVYQTSELLVFASEIKPIKAIVKDLVIDELALAYYRWLGYVPAHMSIYKGCRKFSAASFAQINLNLQKLEEISPKLYWDPLVGFGRSYIGSYDDAVDEFCHLLDDATRIRAEADVPVGVFLSGGIDSSLVVASLAAQKKSQVSVFTVKVDDPEIDESATAAETARSLGLQMNQVRLNKCDFDRQLGKIWHHFDEPFSDSSQIPTLAISEAASQKVTVVLTGDGGDEVFLGYPRFSQQAAIAPKLKYLSRVPILRSIIGMTLESRVGAWLLSKALTATGVGAASFNLESRISRIKSIFAARDSSNLYETVMAVCQKQWLSEESQHLLGASSLVDIIKSWYPNYNWDLLSYRSFEEQIAALDLVTYLRDDVLVKVDRATMAYSIEARSPLLDYRIVEFGTSLPLSYKLNKGVHKRILRDALSRRVQGKVLRLGKKGFGVPLKIDLPPGPNMPTRWNRYVENQWFTSSVI